MKNLFALSGLIVALASPSLAAQPTTITDPAGINKATVNASGQLNVANAATTATTTPAAFTISNGAAFQQLLATNASRKACTIQNTSNDIMYVYFGATGSATTANSLQAQPGQTVSCSANGYALTDNVAVNMPTTGDTGVVNTQ